MFLFGPELFSGIFIFSMVFIACIPHPMCGKLTHPVILARPYCSDFYILFHHISPSGIIYQFNIVLTASPATTPVEIVLVNKEIYFISPDMAFLPQELELSNAVFR